MGFWDDLFSDPLQLFFDPIGATLDAAGLPVDATRVGWAPWEAGNLGSYIKSDWRAIKHLLVPDLRRDREIMAQGAITSRKIVYGSCRVSGQIAYVESTGASNEYLHMIVILASHPVIGFGSVQLDEYAPEHYGSDLFFKLFDGTQMEACAELVAESNGLWTSAHVLKGQAYIYLRFTYNDTLYPSGIPTVKVVVHGKPIYDPRTGKTTSIIGGTKTVGKLLPGSDGIWHDNPALCLRDYMLLPEEQGGMGCTLDEIDDESIIDAANACDQPVAKSADGLVTENRYTCNGTVAIENTPKGILDALKQAMAGEVIFSQGKWRVYAAAPLPTDLSGLVVIDESWLNGGLSVKCGSTKNERLNTIKGTFIDPDDKWAAKGFPTITSATYIADDLGEELANDLTLNFTTSSTMSQRIAKVIMERSRRGMVVDMTCNFKAWDLAVWQLVKLNNSQLGFSEKLFRVLDWQFDAMGGIKLSLGEEDPNIYDWTPGDVVEIPEIPETTLPDPWNVPYPPDLLVRDTLYISTTGQAESRVIITWSRPATPYDPEYDITVQHLTLVTSDGLTIERLTPCWKGTTRDTVYNLDGLDPGLYMFEVVARNGLGAVSVPARRGAWIYGKTLPPANITGLSVSFQRGMAYLSWDPVPDLDVKTGGSIVVQHSIAKSGASWDTSVPVGEFPGAATAGAVAAQDGTYLVRAVDSSGNGSATAAVIVSTVPDMLRINEVATITESPTFGGTKTSCSVAGGKLTLDTISLLDSLAGNWDSLSGSFDDLPGTQTGNYLFSNQITLTQVSTTLITASIASEQVSLAATFDDMALNVDSWRGMWDGNEGGASVRLMISVSQDGVNWSSFVPWVRSWYKAKAFKFRLDLTSYDVNYSVGVSDLGITADMEDLVQSGRATVTDTGLSVTFPTTFYSDTPHVSITIYDATAGDYPFITATSKTGFTVEIRDASNIPVERTIDWFAKGY